MKTFQNRGEGFDVGKELDGLLISDDVGNQSSKFFNRCHMWCDVIDDEIVDFFRSKERTKSIILTESAKELHNRIHSFSADDEILLGDEEISSFFGEVFFVSWKRNQRRI